MSRHSSGPSPLGRAAAALVRRGGPSEGRFGLRSRPALALSALALGAALGVAAPLTGTATGGTSSPVALSGLDNSALLSGTRPSTSGAQSQSTPRWTEGTPPHASDVAGSPSGTSTEVAPPAGGTSSSGGPTAALPVTPATAEVNPPAALAGDARPDPASSDPTAGAVEVGPGPDAAARLEEALATSPLVTMPPGEYVFERAPSIPDDARIVGAGKSLTKWFHAFDGDFAVLPESATLENLTIQGQGTQFSGRGLVLAGNAGRQVLDNVAVLGFDGYCIDFETIDAGSQFRAAKLDVARVDADPTGDRYAVHMADGFQNSAVPRSFYQVETQGSPFAYLGGSNDVYVTASTIGAMEFTDNTRGFHLGESRWLNQLAVEIHGHGVTVTGVGIRPGVTVMPGADNVHFDGSYFNAGAVDESGAGNNTGLPPAA